MPKKYAPGDVVQYVSTEGEIRSGQVHLVICENLFVLPIGTQKGLERIRTNQVLPLPGDGQLAIDQDVQVLNPEDLL